jgi:TPP-dependent pyruvate/acetoin dehydrogenase alpha subunit
VGDPGTGYRPKDEIAAWKARDPVAKLREQVLEAKIVEAQEFDAIDAEVRKLIDEAAEYSLQSPQPDAATALDHVYSN